MADALGGYGAQEEAQRQKLGATASQVSASCLSKTTVAAAQAVIKAVKPDAGRGAVREPAADLRQVRTSPELLKALRADLQLAEGQALLLIGDALWIGFRAGVEHRTETLKGEHLTFQVNMTAEDRADLVGYPILGLTALEWAQSLRRQLEEGVNRALAIPLTTGIDPSTIPPALAQVATAHAGRVAGGVMEAHAAGCQAALHAVTDALTGAA